MTDTPEPTVKPEPTVNATPKSSSSPKRIVPKDYKPPNYFKPITAKATSTQANRQILLAVGTGVGVVMLARLAGTPNVKRLNDPGDLIKIAVGTGATIIGLMVIAEVAPDVAIGLAWLILIGALLTYGVDFAQALSKGTLSPGIPLTHLGDQPTPRSGTKPGLQEGGGAISF